MTVEQAIDAVCDKEPLYASLVTELKPIVDKNIPTMGTDGMNLYYNPAFINKLTDQELCGTILHETLHCVFRHIWRKGKRDHMTWNAATDYALNPTVLETYQLPQGALVDMKYYGLSSEEIYKDLEQKQKEKKGKNKQDQGNGKNSKQNQSGGVGQQKWCDHSRWEGAKNGKKKKQTLIDKVLGRNKEPKEMDSAVEQKWKRLMEKNILEKYGTLPDSLKRIISKSYYIPVLDWTSLVSNLLSEDTNDYTFSMPDRRFLEADFFLPGLASVDRLKDVVFAYDTSGSITQQDLHSFYLETMNLFNNFSSLQGWVAICDWSLHSFKEISPQTNYEEFEFVGGGGTSFKPVFDAIKRKDLKPKAVFYFTDTEGEFPEEVPDYPVFWLVRSSVGDNYPRIVPFGNVIKFLPKS